MGRSETFEHTADLGLRIFGADLADIFRTAAEGLFDIIVANRQEIVVVHTERVSLSAESAEDLLFEWLKELIYLSETEHRVFTRFDVGLNESGCGLEASVGGEAIDAARHVLDHEVKAVTRHGLSLRHQTEGWVAEVILDI